MTTKLRTPRCGDIGPVRKRVEFDPMRSPAPQEPERTAPAPTPVPAEPQKVPA